jgi:myo-inositol catabolism protein IolH
MKIVLDPALIIDRPIAESFEAAVEFGYDGVELGNRDDVIPANGPLAFNPAQLLQARRAAAATGCEITSVAVIQAWSSPDEERRQQAVKWWIDGVHAAVELGADRIDTELSGDPNRPAECRAAFLRSFEQIDPVLEAEGISVAVEPHPWDFLETTQAALELIAETGSGRLKYLHCLPHSYYLGGSITDQIALAGSALDHIHVADTFRPQRSIVNPPGLDCRIHQHFDIGAGELDWAEAQAALRGVSFDGIATVQVFFWPDRARESFAGNRQAISARLGLGLAE